MSSLDALVEKAIQSALFTAPVLEPDLTRFIQREGDHIKALAQKAMRDGYEHIFWVGSGNSWCNLYSGKYLLDRFTDLPSDYYQSYELIWRAPRRLNAKSLAVFASYSGATEDTLNALQFARSKGAHTVSIVNKADSPMGEAADEVIPFESKALYILPLAAAYLFALEVARLQGASEASAVIDGLRALPPTLGQLYRDEKVHAAELASQFADEKVFYVLGSGPLYGLAYKFGLTVFMENMRVHGSFVETSEFRHGPVEMLERNKPPMVFLVGTDESRVMSERVIALAQKNGARTIVYDMASYPGIHPLLSPFVLMVPLQWFAVYGALLRGITDLDDRVFMGRGLLNQGQKTTWP
ncbi:MAG: SIS domain-containing protein [Chloroflexi bacterium]|nr:SIS domain-containing protein [Chloroflexota bacterium]